MQKSKLHTPASTPIVSKRFTPPLFLTALAVITAAPAANANTLVSATATAQPTALTCSGTLMTETNQGTGPQSAAASFTSSNCAAEASADVSFGAMHLYGQINGVASALGAGTIKDDVLITAPGIAAWTPGTLTYTIDVSGAIDGAGGGLGSWGLSTYMGNQGLAAGGHADDVFGYYGDPFGTYTVQVDFFTALLSRSLSQCLQAQCADSC